MFHSKIDLLIVKSPLGFSLSFIVRSTRVSHEFPSFKSIVESALGFSLSLIVHSTRVSPRFPF